MRLLFLVALGSSIWMGLALAEDSNSQTACAATAFRDYLAANQAFRERHGVNDQIAQRRLQEQFCLRFVQCVALDQGRSADPEPGAGFANCLKEEAIELYRLYKD